MHASQDWQVYIDQSRASLDRNGYEIYDAFCSLCYTLPDDADRNIQGNVEVQVIPAIIPKPATGGKPPWIRCIWNTKNEKNAVRPSPNLDINKVDSIEKVYRVLTKHLGMTVRMQHNSSTTGCSSQSNLIFIL